MKTNTIVKNKKQRTGKRADLPKCDQHAVIYLTGRSHPKTTEHQGKAGHAKQHGHYQLHVKSHPGYRYQSHQPP